MKEFTCGSVVPGCTARFVDVSEDAIASSQGARGVRARTPRKSA
jgi:hypothetical protein